MITNDKQFKSARAAAERLKVDRQRMVADAGGGHPALLNARLAALDSQIVELEDELAEYEHLQSGAVTQFEAEGLSDLPDILIKARIARGMSQKDLGAFLGVAEQQIQRYEAERYRTASLERLSEIVGALNIHVRETALLASSAAVNDAPPHEAFPIAEMFKRGYFEDFAGTLTQARKASDTLVPTFFQQAAYRWTPIALHRRSIRAGSSIHPAALAAWEARVCVLANRRPALTRFDAAAVTTHWLQSLRRLSREADAPLRAREHLAQIGLTLVIEPHLPGTLLDGAALRTPTDVNVVALTLRYDRLDNFWFTLVHEIAHQALHIRKDGYQAIFDEMDTDGSSAVEAEADAFALETLIPEAEWRLCVARFTRTEKAVRADAARLQIHPAIVAGRIRREANDYTLLPGLIGSGEVRRQFAEES